MARHLTFADREFLQRMVAQKKSKSEIAALMKRHRSTIYREVKPQFHRLWLPAEDSAADRLPASRSLPSPL